ncbi:MAG: hypothetical protein P4L42_09415 [Desulfocapsaceae bacterium]|nr:hypothetical protein [Desulfocapsaceae bacterium]
MLVTQLFCGGLFSLQAYATDYTSSITGTQELQDGDSLTVAGIGLNQTNGTITGLGSLTITTTGGLGAHAVSAQGAHSRINLAGPTVIAASGDGLHADNSGEMSISGTSTITADGDGVYANKTGSLVDLKGPTRITVSGNGSRGVAAEGQYSLSSTGGIVQSAGDVKIFTTGSSSPGVYAYSGKIMLNGTTTVDTKTANSYGIYAGSSNTAKNLSEIFLKDTTVDTAGSEAHGIYAYNQYSQIFLDGAKTTVTTTGKKAYGLFVNLGGRITAAPGSTLTVTTTNTDSSGGDPIGIYATGAGKVSLENVTVTTAAARGMLAQAAATITATGAVKIKSGDVGVQAANGGLIDLTGTTRIDTSTGLNAHGVSASGAVTVVNIHNFIITTKSTSPSHGAYADSATLNLKNGRISTLGAGADLYQTTWGGATNTTGINASGVNIYTSGGTGNNSNGVHIYYSAGWISIDNSNIVTGVQMAADGTPLRNADNTYAFNTSAGGNGIVADYAGTVYVNTDRTTLQPTAGTSSIIVHGAGRAGMMTNNANTKILAANTDLEVYGNNGRGLLASNGTIGITNSSIFTSGAGALGVSLTTSASSVLFNGEGNSITTAGTDSHAISVSGGAKKIFDGSAGNVLPTVAVTGAGSAALRATGSGSVLTLAGTTALSTSMMSGAGTWGAKAEGLGSIAFTGSSSTGGSALWANSSGSLVLKDQADATGSHVRLTGTSSSLDLRSLTGDAWIGSLEGNGSVQFGSKTLSLGSIGALGGSLLDNADFSGSFTIDPGSTFELDLGLDNQTGSFDLPWNGRDLTKAGEGTLIFSAGQTYTGTTTLNTGQVQLAAAHVIDSSSDVIVHQGTLDLGRYDQTFNRLSGLGGTIQLGGATLGVNNAMDGDNSHYAGNIVGAGDLVKTGAGELILSGTTGWSGDTHLGQGTLTLDGSNGGGQLNSDIYGVAGSTLNLHNRAALRGMIDPADVNIRNSRWGSYGGLHRRPAVADRCPDQL